MKAVRFACRALALLLVSLVCCLLVPPGIRAQEDAAGACRPLRPSATDPALAGWDEPHLVCLPTAVEARRGLLWLFLPGTGATPEMYSALSSEAARTGLHAIGLTYPNDRSVNFQICPHDDDPDCHEKIRREIVLGVPASRHVAVDEANAIEGRLQRALQHLGRVYPDEGWQAYLNADGSVRWDLVLVVGHSQGGGHAAYLAKLHRVARAVLFAWADVRRGELAPWLTQGAPRTPAADHYLFWHADDVPVANHQEALMAALRLDAFGAPVVVDGRQPPYGGSHGLVATATPPSGELPHNVHVVDRALVFDAEGAPLYRDVWRHLMGAEAASEAIASPVQEARAVRIGVPGVGYIDPEFYSDLDLMAFADGERRVWLASLDPESGRPVAADGREVLVDVGVTPLNVSFNGPEFGVDRRGWALFYTKAADGLPQPWRATLEDGRITRGPLIEAPPSRLSILPAKNPEADSTALMYVRDGDWGEGHIGYLNEADPAASESGVPSSDTGARWIDGTAAFTFVHTQGPDVGQVAIHDGETGRTRTITDSPGVKSLAYGWRAPETGGLLVLAVVDDAAIEVYAEGDGVVWERRWRLTLPAESAGAWIGSPEPFVANGRSYISLALKQGAGYVPAEVWVWGVEDGAERVLVRCDDGQGRVIRTDPEVYLGRERAFVYYNLIRGGGGRASFELYKCDTGLAP